MEHVFDPVYVISQSYKENFCIWVSSLDLWWDWEKYAVWRSIWAQY